MSVIIYVADLPEFAPIIRGAQKQDDCFVEKCDSGYWKISSPSEIHFNRKALGLGPALWYSALSGGFVGEVVEYGREQMILSPSK